VQEIDQDAGQETDDEYCKALVKHFPDSNNTVKVGQQGAEETKADHLRSHCGTNNIGRKAYGEGGYNRIRSIRIDGEKYQKD